MNREIKFRAWDKMNKKMTYGGAFFDDTGANQWVFGMPTPHPDDTELMQFTGLEDKNGRHIYEGDIVVEFFRGDRRVGVITIEPTRGVVLGGISGVWPHNLEVVGNIYENPDWGKYDAK